ncbi:MAG: hypothetical protein AAGA81_11590 [Acidobacteriota bacterium]
MASRPPPASALGLCIARTFDRLDLEILVPILGPGAVRPAHAEGAPGLLLPLEGKAEDKSWRLTLSQLM